MTMGHLALSEHGVAGNLPHLVFLGLGEGGWYAQCLRHTHLVSIIVIGLSYVHILSLLL